MPFDDFLKLLEEQDDLFTLLCENPEERLKVENPITEKLKSELYYASSHLDFIQVLSKNFDFMCLKASQQTVFTFMPSQWSKPFPRKLFKAFPTRGHSYFIGVILQLETFFLFEPKEEECDCCSEKSHVEESIGDLIRDSIILGLFGAIPILERQALNLTIYEEENNYGEHRTWDVLLSFLQAEEVSTFLTNCWEGLKQHTSVEFLNFVSKHTPRIIFSNFGQNVPTGGTSVLDLINDQFIFGDVAEFSFSLAVNLSVEGKSVVLSEEKIYEIFGKPNVNIFRKVYHPQFCNWEYAKVGCPQNMEGFLEETDDFKRSVSGLHGYSDVANVLRRSATSEPFAKKPISALLNVEQNARPTTTNEATFRNKTKGFLQQSSDQIEKIKLGISDKMQ